MIGQVTGKDEHFQARARYGVCNALDQNDVFDIGNWRRAVQRSKEQRDEVLRLFYHFQEEQEDCGMGTDGKGFEGRRSVDAHELGDRRFVDAHELGER